MMWNFLQPKSWFAPQHPAIVRNQAAFAHFDQNRPLTEYSFVACDTELTGFDRKKDEIVSIGAVLIKDLQIDLGASFHHLVRPRKIQHIEATLVHRITPQQLESVAPLEEALPAFIEFAGDSLLVGHFVELDMSFLNRAARRLLGDTLSNPGIDTMRMAQGYRRVQLGHFHEEGAHSYSYALADLAKEFHLPQFKAHDALEDALQTAYLFLFFLKKFRKGGLVTLKDIYQAGGVGRSTVRGTHPTHLKAADFRRRTQLLRA
jgi:DNA polymerase-3 subunit epsilon